MACPLNHRKLKSKANAEKRYILLARPFDRQNHTLNAPLTKSTRDKDTAGEKMRTVISRQWGKHHFAPTTIRHASWYFLGFASCWSGSRSDDSTHYQRS